MACGEPRTERLKRSPAVCARLAVAKVWTAFAGLVGSHPRFRLPVRQIYGSHPRFRLHVRHNRDVNFRASPARFLACSILRAPNNRRICRTVQFPQRNKRTLGP